MDRKTSGMASHGLRATLAALGVQYVDSIEDLSD